MTYTLYGQTPPKVLTPLTEQALAEVLRDASTSGEAVVPWGSGTRQHIGAPPARYDIALRTAALDQIVEYTPADLVLTAQAGATLGSIQAALAEYGQRLPWDPPTSLDATIGGLLASGAAGPLRLGYGTPRDWTLGMRVALSDGRVVKSGSKVVKNVAGYDSHKLHLGALGTLGVIVEATFKIAPQPACQRTVLASFGRLEDALGAIDALRNAPLAPVSLVVMNQQAAHTTSLPEVATMQPGHALIVARFAGVTTAVERQLDLAARRCEERESNVIETLADEHDERVWQTLAGFSAGGSDEIVLRAGARPGELPRLAHILETTAERHGWSATLMLYGGIGLAYARLSPTDLGISAALVELRADVANLGGYVVVEDAPEPLRTGLDIWGPPPQTLPLMRALKNQWNPHDTLNPGRYIV